MKTVILAAGEGRRMNNTVPKPLTKILGLSLIERVILSVKECGLKDFIIVLGYKGEEIKRYISGQEKFTDLNLSFVLNESWHEGNGRSLFKVWGLVEGDFLLLMADHIFSPALLKKFLEDEGEAPKMVIIKNQKFIPNIVTETKVKIVNGNVFDLGKDLKEFDGIDGGIFLLNQKVFLTSFFFAQNTEGGEAIPLSLIIKDFALRHPLKAFVVEDGYVINVNTKEAQKFTERVLLNDQTKKDDGLISKLINRRISKYLTQLLLLTPLSPNQISLIAFLISLLSGVSFIFSSVLGGIFAQLSSLLDGVDGEVARLRFQKSSFGAYLDPILDRYGDSFIIFFIALSLYLKFPNPIIWLVTFFALIGSFMSQITRDRFFVVRGKEYPKMKESWLRYLPITRDLRLFLIMLGGLTDKLFPTLILLSIITNLKTILRLLFVKRFLRESAESP